MLRASRTLTRSERLLRSIAQAGTGQCLQPGDSFVSDCSCGGASYRFHNRSRASNRKEGFEEASRKRQLQRSELPSLFPLSAEVRSNLG